MEECAGTSFSSARIFCEAAALLARDPATWPFFHGPTLALATGHEDAVEARFVAAIPDVRLAVQAVRPISARHLERVERLYGAEVRAALAARGSTGSPRAEVDRNPAAARGSTGSPRAEEDRNPAAARGSTGSPRAGEDQDHASARGSTGSPRAEDRGIPRAEELTERDLLATYLLADAAVLADPARPRSGGPDGTVDLEEHAGVEAELEATALWVARQVLEARRPLEEVAVLVPAQDPLAGLVADRLARLPLGGGSLPVFVAGGLPAISTAAGARILAVVRALRSHLSAETLAPVLAALRLEGVADGDRTHLTHGEGMELAFGLGIVGGNPAHPAGALAWSERAAVRAGELEAALGQVHADDDSAERERWRLERTLRSLRAIRPALDALVGVARAVVGGAPLAAIADVLGGFLARWLLAPGEGATLPARLVEAIAPACAGSLGKALSGDDALQVVEDHLLGLRVAHGRFGEPAVYVGTVAGAAGLAFGAVRIVGLCEGVLPSQPREDPVVPGAFREQLERGAPDRVLRRAEDRVAAQVHALVAAVQGARDAVALSAPRVDLARTEREPGAIFIDAAAALARPHAGTGEPAEAVPDGAALRRDAFRPAARAAARFRDAQPISDASWLDRVARTAPALPPEWTGAPVVDLARLATLRAPTGPLGPSDGVFGRGGPFPPVPGIAPERPISASALGQLLQCPRLFLMRRILGWDEPAGAPSLRELDPLSFGSLLHRVVELFYREHGAAFSRREGTIDGWQARARAVADRAFDALLSEVPLVGEGVRLKERERLHDALRVFLAYDWEGGPRRFVGVELAFGTPGAPLSVDADGETLHVHGYIDRVDVEDGVTLVRDLKSGKAHPRAGSETGPTPLRDVQLGLYQLAARKLANAWKTPAKVQGAYAYASGRGEVEERAFRADAAALDQATAEWLATAAHLLAARSFPPSADEDDCTYCPFHVVCGSGATRRAREALADVEDGPLARFRALKLDEGDEE
ncbi:PD-(D/E)XK nuclease family protein [Anaeromyxobacter sp. PSR-1]|uniref:PD-(D/E)XK nuclease family protein n=1 Tax=Anaeromyxobacter sp. PSR-1 TaxID=1300915 RepID=UPI001ED9BF2F|nr:PD-(D/E)XK nuclease family protein [Anaeromyxobacter sp. PSR-1]